MSEAQAVVSSDPSEVTWTRMMRDLESLIAPRVIVETQANIEAMTRAIAKRTQSNRMRSAAERDALIGLYQEVAIALGLFRKESQV